ncbi:MAG: endolytic transglycosylase MltG [Vulcanimicrobiaceae bacterium]
MRRLGAALALVVTLALVAAIAGAFWFRQAVSVDRRFPTHETTVVVPRGATGHDVARLLASSGVIGSQAAFEILARVRREQSAMKAGEFRFAPHATASEVLRQVVEGGRQIAVWLTIPEGYTDREVAASLAEHGFASAATFERAFARESLVLGGVRTRTLEGYLYPDSYLIPKTAPAPRIVKLLTDQFRAALPRDAEARARALHLTIPQVVTVASLVEREAKVDSERPLMAGVYYNRLRRGMPLQVDATIEYTFAKHKTAISFADLRSDSPYNTYRHLGLPPTPIANPGRPSLDAAFHPRASDYLYYVYMGNGRSAFARTLAEHNANVARYLH